MRSLLSALAVAGLTIFVAAPPANAAGCAWNGYAWVCHGPGYNHGHHYGWYNGYHNGWGNHWRGGHDQRYGYRHDDRRHADQHVGSSEAPHDRHH